MTTATANPATFEAHASIASALPPRRSLRSVVADASVVVVEVPSDDPRWELLGPRLTAFVDASRRAAGQPGSPIRAGDIVAPVLRLRDLARLAQITVTTPVVSSLEAESALRSLQVVALR
jgi:hypothetical protein